MRPNESSESNRVESSQIFDTAWPRAPAPAARIILTAWAADRRTKSQQQRWTISLPAPYVSIHSTRIYHYFSPKSGEDIRTSPYCLTSVHTKYAPPVSTTGSIVPSPRGRNSCPSGSNAPAARNGRRLTPRRWRSIPLRAPCLPTSRRMG